MKVFVTGTEGYIGSVLAPTLVAAGHEVHGVDTGFYTRGWLYDPGYGPYPTESRDIRDLTAADLVGFDAVVHMAELSNDPLGQFNPGVTHAINHQGSVRLAEACQEAGVPRFVYTSSCSVYGLGEDGFRTEESATNPQTAYAECKVLVERDVIQMANDGFSPTFLRNATAFGPSPRMRFDIVLNNLAGLAWTTKEIALTSDGTPWRPLVHVADICEAIRCTLEAPREAVHNEIFNVGATDQNYQVREIAQFVAEALPGCELTIGSSDGDNRSYRVSFDKIRERLPGFRCRRDAQTGARELMEVFDGISMTPEVFTAALFTRLKQLREHIEGGMLDRELRWQPEGAAAR